MKTKLIMIEGIPGSGKTTIAVKVKEFLVSQGLDVKLYSEGDLHPADLAWCALLSLDEYENLILTYPQYKELIHTNTCFEDQNAIVSYTKLCIDDQELMKFFEAHEVYDGRVGLERFTEIHLKRWSNFALSCQDNTVYIFECAYLQNHICELMGTWLKDKAFIEKYFLDLIHTVMSMNPLLIYLTQANITETIRRVAVERVAGDNPNRRDWIELVTEWVEKSNFGKVNGLKGLEGVIQFFTERKSLEMDILESLPIDQFVVDNPDYHWDKVISEIQQCLLNKYLQ